MLDVLLYFDPRSKIKQGLAFLQLEAD